MNEIKCDGLCIRSIDYKENDKLITIYAFGKGKITALAKGVKKPTAKLRYASSLLCFGTYFLSEKNGFYTLIGCDLIDSFYDVWKNIDKYFPAVCALELIDRFALDNDVNDNLSIATLEFIKELCYDRVDSKVSEQHSYEDMFIGYMLNVLEILGYELQCEVCTNCGAIDGTRIYFAPHLGGILFDCCGGNDSDEITYELYVALKHYINRDEVLDISQRRGVITLLYRYMQYILKANYKAMEEYIRFLR